MEFTTTEKSSECSATRSEVRWEIRVGMPPAVVRKVLLRSVDHTPVMTAAIPSVPGPVVVVAWELVHELLALLVLPPLVAV